VPAGLWLVEPIGKDPRSQDRGMISTLSRAFPSRHGAPILDRVDTAIFTTAYFRKCMDCGFCKDWCCQWGVDVDLPNVARILAQGPALEAATGQPREKWFKPETWDEPDYPGGGYRRTQVVDGACVFLDRADRGCKLHRFALTQGIDHHDIKPMMSSLFPLSFDAGVLLPALEVRDGSLVCGQRGDSIYAGARDALLHYFGAQLIAELDALDAGRLGPPPA
jgi:Putative zinc- or iron-chelating domain